VKKHFFKYRRIIKFSIDSVGWISATVVAYLIRLDGFPSGYVTQMLLVTGLLAPVKIASVWFFRTHRQAWRNTSFADLFRLNRMVGLVSILFLTGVLLLRNTYAVPFSIPVLDFLLGVIILCSFRAAVRFLIKYRVPNKKPGSSKKRVLIVGAGESGSNVVREMLKHPKEGLKPVAFLDDDKQKQGQEVNGIPVVDAISEMPIVAEELSVDEILIAMPSETGDTIRRVVEVARSTGIHYRIIPGLYDLVSGKVTIKQIREVDVEDLLRRKQVELQTDRIREYVEQKAILVTGAGGSIGSEIVRQISRFNPRKVILVGRGENSIYELICQLNREYKNLNVIPRICDIRDWESLSYIFRSEKPDVIYHAAAHKHVPLMEQNPSQAILNNVKGTQNLINLAVDHHVSHFINISTDKAVNPSSIMGATKRISEHIVQQAANRLQNARVFVSVRFGNVLGSRGSVIPVFKRQIEEGGPVTVTHPDMVRYFMTIPEASQLVLQAGALNQNGAIYLLDMGEPVNIEQMARDLIRLSGFEPDKDIEIKYTGVRPGEKLFEELSTDRENLEETVHEKIYISKLNGGYPNLDTHLESLFSAAKDRDKKSIEMEIKRIIPSFREHLAAMAESA
jgi:FlaA1/EpsC-like NDP-sugar epimerase